MSRIKLTTNKGTMYPVDLNHLTYSEAVEELNLLEQRTPHDTYVIVTGKQIGRAHV